MPDDFRWPEVAAILKLNQQTIRNWIDQGKLSALHIGRRNRIHRADFDALLASSATDADPKPVSVSRHAPGQLSLSRPSG